MVAPCLDVGDLLGIEGSDILEDSGRLVRVEAQLATRPTPAGVDVMSFSQHHRVVPPATDLLHHFVLQTHHQLKSPLVLD